MWRFPLRVALVPLLGLTLILLGLASYPTQAVTAGTLEATNTPAATSTRRFTFRVVTHGGCPGNWTVTPAEPGNTASITLVITEATRFLGAACADIRANDTLQVVGDAPLDQQSVVTARIVQRAPATPTPAVQSISFRGTIIGNPRPVAGGWEVQFNTEVSGAISVTIPSTLIPGVTPRRGDKADVTAQRQGGGWTATKIQFVSATSDVGFSGLVEFLPAAYPYYGVWKIGGRQVVVNANTVVTGIPKLYRRATVVAEMQGNGMVAKTVLIDPNDAPATAFELAGTAFMNVNPFTGVSRLGCLTFTLDPATALLPGIASWIDMNNKPLRVAGSRTLGTNSSFTADTAALPGAPFANLTDVEVMGYIDLRQDISGATDINLQIGHILVRLPRSLPNQLDAAQGTVVRVKGGCLSLLINDEIQATSIEVLSRPYVAFAGSIEVIETSGYDISGFQIRPPGSNDRQHIVRDLSVPIVGSNEPAVGGCLSGYGYYLRDGSIRAQRVEVVGCAPGQLYGSEEEAGSAPSR